jgi:hypothetical protein
VIISFEQVLQFIERYVRIPEFLDRSLLDDTIRVQKLQKAIQAVPAETREVHEKHGKRGLWGICSVLDG